MTFETAHVCVAVLVVEGIVVAVVLPALVTEMSGDDGGVDWILELLSDQNLMQL